MRKLIRASSTIILLCITTNNYAQTVSRRTIGDDRELLMNARAAAGIAAPKHAPASQSLQSTIYIPLHEEDSVYYAPGSTWNTGLVFTKTYYQSNCRDSVVLYDDPTYHTRETFKYDAYNYITYDLTETMNASPWVNSLLFVGENLPVSCYFNYQYDLFWNGASWDTADGKRTSFITYNMNNDPLVITRQTYNGGSWKNFRKYVFTYDGSQRLASMEIDYWNSGSSQFEPYSLENNHIYDYYNSFCDSRLNGYDFALWNSSSWEPTQRVRNTGYYNNKNDTSYILQWNSISYDTADISINVRDIYGNDLGFVGYTYDQPSHTATLTSFNVDSVRYGSHNEIVRKVNYNDNQLGPGVVTINRIQNFSNFITCNSPLGEHEITSASAFSVSPNPLTYSCLLQFGETVKDAQLLIYDVTGREMLRKTFSGQSTELTKGDLQAGLYIVRINAADRQYVQKIVVQ